MTTIAYKDGVIAYDSRICAGNTIFDDDFDKKVEKEGLMFFLAGATSDYGMFIESFFAGKNIAERPFNVTALVVIGSELWDSSIDEDGIFWKSKLRMDTHYAYGSGSDHALTAMDMGESAVKAIEWAMKRDCKTGGRIRSFNIPLEMEG